MGGSPIPRKVTNVQVLRFDDPPKGSRKKKSSSKFLLPISLLIAVGLFGSTFAANISINSGSSLEFGQGVLNTAACDDSITVAPASSYSNSSGYFKFASVTVSDVAQACDGKTLTVRAYPSSGETALNFGSSSAGYSFSTLSISWSSVSITTPDGWTAERLSSSGTVPASFKFTVGTTSLDAGSVARMTIESSGS
jgi:hypothetical protein